MPRPLDGMKIVDLTHMLAGPFATNQLHLMGAEVIKIEPVGRGDAVRWGNDGAHTGLSASFVAINSGKKSVAVDLKKSGGRQMVIDLCQSSDALVENFRPGVMDELGLGYTALSAINPRLVYCSISGYGQDGPMRSRPAYDHVVQAITGMAVMNGDQDQDPIKVGFPAVDTVTGMSASTAILAALLRRERSGEGQYIDVSMVDSAALLMYTMVTGYLATGEEPRRTGNRGFTGSPGCDTFPTAEGHIALGANTPDQFARLCEVLDIPEVMRDPALLDPSMLDGSRKGFALAADAVALRTRLAEALKRATAAQWEQQLNDASVPAARVHTVGEFADTMLNDRPGSVLHLPPIPGHTRGVRTLNAGFRTRFDPPGTEQAAAVLGQHTREVLQRLGYPETAVQALFENRVVAAADARLPGLQP